jgi:hypothetical protein
MTAGVSMAVMAPLFQLETKVSILVATSVQKTRLCACCLVGDGDLIVEPPQELSSPPMAALFASARVGGECALSLADKYRCIGLYSAGHRLRTLMLTPPTAGRRSTRRRSNARDTF